MIVFRHRRRARPPTVPIPSTNFTRLAVIRSNIANATTRTTPTANAASDARESDPCTMIAEATKPTVYQRVSTGPALPMAAANNGRPPM